MREVRERYGDGGDPSRASGCTGIQTAMPGDKLGHRGDPSTARKACAQGERVFSKMKQSRSARKSKDPYSPVRWYNEVFAETYKEASGQLVLSGGREYRAAGTYFSRLRELNPELGPKEIYERASDGARFMLESQARGGVFGWMHCPPDICMLSSQAQAVDYHLRKTVLSIKAKKTGTEEQKPLSAGNKLREKEAEYEPEEITRLYGELRGLGGTGG